MNNAFKKRSSIACLILFLIFVFATSIVLVKNDKKHVVLFLYNKQDEEITIYPFNKENVDYYVIPSGFEIKDFFFNKQDVYCDDSIFDFNCVKQNEIIEIKVDGKNKNICFLLTDNTPTLFIKTIDKDIEYINADKNNIANINTLFYNSKGKKINDNLKGTINGRGHATWQRNKKPYILKFNKEISFFGYNEAKKWILLANDDTNLNNKIVYDFANKTKLEWSPKCDYINLYVNGEYLGLYLLSEKVEISSNRLSANDNEVLFKREFVDRLDLDGNDFITNKDNGIVVEYPKNILGNEKEYLKDKVQEMEDAICDLNSDAWINIIDMESWARVYLIDEIFDQIDAGIASSYFYLKNDGKFYRGPIWDYDYLMTNENPYTVSCDQYYRYRIHINLYYNMLMKRPEFKQKVIEILNDEYCDLVVDISREIDSIVSEKELSIYADNIRYNRTLLEEDYNKLKDFIIKKIVFLDEYWRNEDDYCHIQIEDSFFYNYVVKKGNTILEAINFNDELLNSNYYYYDTGEPFDVNEPIKEDIVLIKESEEYLNNNFISRFGLLNMMFCFCFVLIMVILILRLHKGNNI